MRCVRARRIPHRREFLASHGPGLVRLRMCTARPPRSALRAKAGLVDPAILSPRFKMPDSLHQSLETLFRELIDGPDANAAWMLNAGDTGLLRSLAALSAAAASTMPKAGGASIAAHVDHLRY